MTEIQIISSGSNANGYLLKSGNQVLVLELGCRSMEYVEALKDNFSCVTGCIASHCHSDHLNKSTAKEFIRRGVPVFVGEKVYEELLKGGSIMGIKPLPMRQKTFIGGFTVQPFETPHNVPNYGFLIETPTQERIVFVTDTTGVPLRFKDINCLMVECNHDDDTMFDNFINDNMGHSSPEYHMGLEECCTFCVNNMSLDTKAIILIHLSLTNINPHTAVEKVKKAINNPAIKVDFAEKGRKFIVESDFF